MQEWRAAEQHESQRASHIGKMCRIAAAHSPVHAVAAQHNATTALENQCNLVVSSSVTRLHAHRDGKRALGGVLLAADHAGLEKWQQHILRVRAAKRFRALQ